MFIPKLYLMVIFTSKRTMALDLKLLAILIIIVFVTVVQTKEDSTIHFYHADFTYQNWLSLTLVEKYILIEFCLFD